MKNNCPSWLRNTVIYSIYPQSFYDSDGDGCGDLKGIKEKLPYIKELGCNAVWMNPIFESDFLDAGYDVKDFYKIAPRYGTKEDLTELCEYAHSLGMKVLLNLVAGHTSDKCDWFVDFSSNEDSRIRTDTSGRLLTVAGCSRKMQMPAADIICITTMIFSLHSTTALQG